MVIHKKQKIKELITQEQAIELADKYLLYTGKIALRDNISIGKSVRGWQIVATTTPIILGMPIEISSFPIDIETGEVGAVITAAVSIPEELKKINQQKDIDETKKEQLNTKVREFEDAIKKPVDRNKINELKKWFETNASHMKTIIDFIKLILKFWDLVS